MRRREHFSRSEVFDSLDGEQDPFLVAELDNPDVLKVLPCKLCYVVYRVVALTSQRRAVLLQS